MARFPSFTDAWSFPDRYADWIVTQVSWLALLAGALLISTEAIDVYDRLGGPSTQSILILIAASAVVVNGLKSVIVRGFPTQQPKATRVGLSRNQIYVLVGIATLGLLLRLLRLSGFSYTADESLHYGLAQNIPSTIIPQLPSGLIYIRSFVFTYLTAASTLLFGLTPAGLRLPAALIGSGLVVLAFIAGRDFFSPRVGLVAAFFLAVDNYMLGFSQLARFYILFYALALAVIYAYYKSFIIREWPKWAFTLIASLAVVTHDLAAFLLPAFSVWWFIQHDSIADIWMDKLNYGYVLIPGVIFSGFYKLKSYLFTTSIPGGKLGLIQKPIFGVNTANIVYYRELLLNPYIVFWAVLVVFCALLTTRTINLSARKEFSLVYLASFALPYVIGLGFFVRRDALRFVIVVVPLLALIFAAALIEVWDAAKTEARGAPLPNFIVVLFALNLIAGSMIVTYDHDIHTVPDTEESNLVLLNEHLVGHEHAFTVKATHKKIPNIKGAAEYVKMHASDDAIIISSANFNPVDPYVNVDYSTNDHISSYLGYRQDGQRYEMYRGIPVLTSKDQIQEVYQQGKPVYVVADMRLEAHATPEVQAYIKENSELVYTSEISNTSKHTWLFGEDTRVRVYKFTPDKSTTK